MVIIKGQGVSGGIAFGEIYYYSRTADVIVRNRTNSSDEEYERFEHSRDMAVKELSVLHAKAVERIGAPDADIFKVHQMMLEDDDFCSTVKSKLKSDNISAEYAVELAAETFAGLFENLDDPLMQARAADIKDISRRVIGILTGHRNTPVLDKASVIAADDLTPSETVMLDRELILGIITAEGSANSHTSILARTMGIPAIVSLHGLDKNADRKTVIVDADSGTVYLEPDRKTLGEMGMKWEKYQNQKKLLNELVGKDNLTLDGKRIDVYANVGSVDDIPFVKKNDAGGIGLFRSEFIYLESKDYPSEESQFIVYKKVLEQMEGKRVVIRTLDIGADKKIDYFNLPKEENPALGFRAIRLCLSRPELFRTQLRALHRASVYGKLAIMFPMITSVREVKEAMAIVEDIKCTLKSENVPFADQIEYGIMIETPAAAIISDILAKNVNFFSIGTNDLIQYTLAADRQNPRIESYVDNHHEAILRLIEQTVKNAHREGIWCGICGELGADPTMTKKFIEFGVDELSVPPAKVLEIRNIVRNS